MDEIHEMLMLNFIRNHLLSDFTSTESLQLHSSSSSPYDAPFWSLLRPQPVTKPETSSSSNESNIYNNKEMIVNTLQGMKPAFFNVATSSAHHSDQYSHFQETLNKIICKSSKHHYRGVRTWGKFAA